MTHRVLACTRGGGGGNGQGLPSQGRRRLKKRVQIKMTMIKTNGREVAREIGAWCKLYQHGVDGMINGGGIVMCKQLSAWP